MAKARRSDLKAQILEFGSIRIIAPVTNDGSAPITRMSGRHSLRGFHAHPGRIEIDKIIECGRCFDGNSRP